MNNNLPHHLLPNLFLTSPCSLQCREHGRKGSLPLEVLCWEVLSGAKSSHTSLSRHSGWETDGQMQHPREQKGLLHQRGWKLPVLLQQTGNTCWFFSSTGKLDKVKWTGQGGRRTRGKWWMWTSYWWEYACLLYLRSTQNFNIRAVLITSVHHWKIKTVQCSQTDTGPSELCCCAS